MQRPHGRAKRALRAVMVSEQATENDDVHPFARFLLARRLGLRLALISLLLTAPCLWLGFHLDDHLHRYMLSDLPGAAELLHAYQSPFGIANGEPDSIRWQIDQGYAPWWTSEHLLVSLWRPISEALHRLDVALFFDNAPLMHAHSLLWWFLLVLAATRLYRGVMGHTTAAGLAALFYAFDHTHGFAIGWIANRNAVLAALFGVLSLHAYHVGSLRDRARFTLLSLLWLGCALLSGEGAVAIAGYLFAHALFMQDGPLPRRLAGLLPHAALIVGWRVAYQAMGRGAHGSGLYVDPVREPLRFVLAAAERAPVLMLGELGLPPAEAYVFYPFQAAQLALAVAVSLGFLWLCWPLLRRDRVARFWALGMLLSLPPACATHPNNRLLFFAGLGAMGLLSQLWHGYVGGAAWLPAGRGLRRVGNAFTAAFAGMHLLLSPLLLPLTTLGVAVASPLEPAVRGLLATPGVAGHTLIVVDAPDYFATKLLRPLSALDGVPGPAHVHALSYGAVPLRVRRSGERSVTIDYGGGLLQRPTDWLYSHPDAPLSAGFTRTLPGMTVHLLAVTPDGRPLRARFDFDAALDAPDHRWVRWRDDHFEPFRWRDVGEGFSQPAAKTPLWLPGT